MTPQAWKAALLEAITAFIASRRVGGLVVHVTLADGENFHLARADAGPGPFVTLHPYPPGRQAEMIQVEGELLDQTPRVVIVPPAFIAKIELLAEVPEQAEVGFQVTPEA